MEIKDEAGAVGGMRSLEGKGFGGGPGRQGSARREGKEVVRSEDKLGKRGLQGEDLNSSGKRSGGEESRLGTSDSGVESQFLLIPLT